MTRYEIHIPTPSGEPRVERVHGENWLDALRRGLTSAGLPAPTRNLAFAIGEDQSVSITDGDTGQVYRVVPVVEAPVGVSSKAGGAEAPVEDIVEDPFADDDVGTVRPMAALPANRPSFQKPAGRRISAMAWGPYRQAPGTHTASDPPGRAASLETIEPARVSPVAPTSSGPLPAPGVPPDALTAALDELGGLGDDVVGAAAYTLEHLLDRVPSAAGAVLLIDPRARCLYVAAARGDGADARVSLQIPLDAPPYGRCLRSRRSLNLVDPLNDERFAPTLADRVHTDLKSWLCVPVVSGRKTFGVIELANRVDAARFTDDEETVMRRAARRFAAHLARVA